MVAISDDLHEMLAQHPHSVDFSGRAKNPLVFPNETGEQHDNMTKVLVGSARRSVCESGCRCINSVTPSAPWRR